MSSLYGDVLSYCIQRKPFRHSTRRMQASISHIAMAKLHATLLKAQRFHLDDDFVYCAYNSVMSKPSNVLAVTQFARAPYPVTWLEFSEKGKLLAGVTRRDSDLVLPTDRIALLIEQETDGTGRVNLFWRHSDISQTELPFSWCVYDYAFDFFGPGFPDLPLIDRRDPADRRSAAEEVAIHKLAQKFACGYSKYLGDDMRAALTAGSSSEDMVSHVMQVQEMAALDWAGEPEFLISSLCLLNSKNITESTTVVSHASAKVNRARIRSGKAPLSDFNVVKLKFGKQTSSQTGGAGSEALRAHLVRGHFKIRKTGVYFWSSFMRGREDKGFINKEYEAVGK